MRVGMKAAKVDTMAPEQVLRIEWGHGDTPAVELTQCPAKECEVFVGREQGEVGVPAELSGSVKDAGLAADQ